MARIYCAKDDILQAAAQFGAAGKPAEGWDFMVQKATSKLPLVSSEGLRFLNRFLTPEQKIEMFHMMTKDIEVNTGDVLETASPLNQARPEPQPILMKKGYVNFNKR